MGGLSATPHVTRALKKIVWKALHGRGFDRVTARSAWRGGEDTIDVVNFQAAVGNTGALFLLEGPGGVDRKASLGSFSVWHATTGSPTPEESLARSRFDWAGREKPFARKKTRVLPLERVPFWHDGAIQRLSALKSSPEQAERARDKSATRRGGAPGVPCERR